MVETRTLLLSDSDVTKCIKWKEALELTEEVLIEQGKGNVEMPPKMMLKLRQYGLDSYSNVMPTYIPGKEIMGVKWGGGFGYNVKTRNGLPFVMQTLILNDPHTGLAKSVMHASYICSLKTACETVVSAKYLAPKGRNLNVMVIGLGVQGQANIHAWLTAEKLGYFDINQFFLIDINQDNLQSAEEIVKKNSDIAVKTDSEAKMLVPEADVIVTLTHTDKENLVMYDWLKKGVYIATLGSFPEVDPNIHLKADKIVVDSWEQNVHRGELQRLIAEGKITKDSLYGEELPQMMANGLGREDDDELISAALIGLGSIDIRYSDLIYNNAIKNNIGTYFEFI